jgi:hypothetical protein
MLSSECASQYGATTLCLLPICFDALCCLCSPVRLGTLNKILDDSNMSFPRMRIWYSLSSERYTLCRIPWLERISEIISIKAGARRLWV